MVVVRLLSYLSFPFISFHILTFASTSLQFLSLPFDFRAMAGPRRLLYTLLLQSATKQSTVFTQQFLMKLMRFVVSHSYTLFECHAPTKDIFEPDSIFYFTYIYKHEFGK